jgi:molecular chaperone GrpE
MKKDKNNLYEQQIEELTSDLQRIRADFENYRKRSEEEKANAKKIGEYNAILKLLPVIDNIERAIKHVPKELKNDAWVKGVVGLQKSLEKSFENLNIERINSKAGTLFNPDLHEAIQFDEESEGDQEVIADELQTGYLYQGSPIRHAMVKVTKK